MFLKNFDLEFSYIEVSLTDSKPLELMLINV